MRIYTENGVRIIEADDGAFVTNGETYSEKVYLGKNAPESAWRDATAEEYEERMRQQDDPEPTADPATPDAWDVEQGEYIPAGRIITVHGVMYECIKDHYAAWSKQPPHAEYWKEV